MSDNLTTSTKTIASVEAENRKQMDEVRKKEKEKAEEDELYVIDQAIIKCPMCIIPVGTLKVNFDSPTVQNKKTATVKEKSALSLKFSGNCLKSPKTQLPCMAVMNLGEWQDVGTTLVQDQKPLIKKSTIKCNYGGSTIEFLKSGQINVPSVIEPVVPKKEVQYVNGHFYNENGSFEGKVNVPSNTGLVSDVYSCTGKGKAKDKDGKEIDIYNGMKNLKISHKDFCFICGVIKSEDSSTFETAAATTQATFNAVKLVKGDNISIEQQAKYASSLLLADYSSVPNKSSLNDENNDQNPNNARAGLIHVLTGGKDYSNEAVAWDGVDFAIKGINKHPKGNDGGISLSKEHYDAFINSYKWTTKHIDTKIINGKKVTTILEGIKYRGTIYAKPASFEGTAEKIATGKWTKGMVLYKSSSVHGQHIFWKPNKSDLRNKGYNWKGLVAFKF